MKRLTREKDEYKWDVKCCGIPEKRLTNYTEHIISGGTWKV